jgi:hypothetical protein
MWVWILVPAVGVILVIKTVVNHLCGGEKKKTEQKGGLTLEEKKFIDRILCEAIERIKNTSWDDLHEVQMIFVKSQCQDLIKKYSHLDLRMQLPIMLELKRKELRKENEAH